MSKHDDGGPAFPRPTTESSWGQTGMSLRDWFAGQALAGLIALVDEDETWVGVAKDAYAIADAMLAERARREEKVELPQ